jgi:hypothetical protein
VFNFSSFLSALEAPLSTVSSGDVLVRAISTVQAVASTPHVELFIDGKSVGVQNTSHGTANFAPHVCACGVGASVFSSRCPSGCEAGSTVTVATNITAVALDSSGKAVAAHELLTGSKNKTISDTHMVLYVDVPSPLTGTGKEWPVVCAQCVLSVRVIR